MGIRVVRKEEGEKVIKELRIMFFHPRTANVLFRLLVQAERDEAGWSKVN